MDTRDRKVRAILGGYSTSSLKLNLPWAVVKDTTRNQLYISDTFNYRIIGYNITTRQSYILIDNNQLYYPTGLALINDTLYIVETGAKSVKKLKLRAPPLTTSFTYSSNLLETVTDKLSVPISVTVHSNGTIYVGDIGLKQVVSIDNVCNKIKIIAGNGSDTDGSALSFGIGKEVVSPNS